MARVDLLLLAVLLGLPSVNYQLFDGLPLSSWPEFVVLALLIPLLVSRALRRLYSRWTRPMAARPPRQPPRRRRYCRRPQGRIAARPVATRASSRATGRLSRPRPPDPASGPSRTPSSGCRDTDRPGDQLPGARLGPGLSQHEPLRLLLTDERAPRTRCAGASPSRRPGRGSSSEPSPGSPASPMSGEVGIAVGSEGPAAEAGRDCDCRPHYGPPVTRLVPMPAGRHPLRIEYLFDDGSRHGGPPPVGPWATLRIERGREPGGREPGAAVSTIRRRLGRGGVWPRRLTWRSCVFALPIAALLRGAALA